VELGEEFEACFTLSTSYPGIAVPPGWLTPPLGDINNQSNSFFLSQGKEKERVS